MKRRKIVICSPQLGISNQTSSGGEVYDREILTQLAALGANIEILLPKGRNHPKIKNFNIDFAPIKTMFPPYVFNLFVLAYLFKIYKGTKFQILRVHSPYFVGVGAVLFKFFHPEIKLVGSYLHLENNNLIFDLINRLIIKKFDLIVTISTATKAEIIQKYGVLENKILVTYPGVSKVFLLPNKKAINLVSKLNLSQKFVLLYLGGLKFRKNPQFLLDVLKHVTNPNVILLIVGSGQALKLLKIKTKMFGLLKKVKFLGFISERDKAKIYNLADVFLLPSKKEGFGMIVTEAAACGVPSIVAATSSLPEVVKDGKTGFVLPLEPKFWAEKINLLAKNEKLRSNMGKSAREYVLKNFSWEQAAKKQLAAFQKLLS